MQLVLRHSFYTLILNLFLLPRSRGAKSCLLGYRETSVCMSAVGSIITELPVGEFYSSDLWEKLWFCGQRRGGPQEVRLSSWEWAMLLLQWLIKVGTSSFYMLLSGSDSVAVQQWAVYSHVCLLITAWEDAEKSLELVSAIALCAKIGKRHWRIWTTLDRRQQAKFAVGMGMLQTLLACISWTSSCGEIFQWKC